MNSTERILPDEMEWLFPEYDFNTIGLITHEGVIIERVLEKGNWEQVRWLFSTYGEKKIADWVQNHGFRLLSKRSFALWALVLDINQIEEKEWIIEAKGFYPW